MPKDQISNLSDLTTVEMPKSTWKPKRQLINSIFIPAVLPDIDPVTNLRCKIRKIMYEIRSLRNVDDVSSKNKEKIASDKW